MVADPAYMYEALGVNFHSRPSSPLWKAFARLEPLANLAAFMDLARERDRLAPLPYRDARAALQALEKELSSESSPLRLLVSVNAGSQAQRDEAQAYVGLLRLQLALAVYHQQHGRYPADLDPLAPALGGELPADPFSGAPYLYRVEGEGYRLWSLGRDLQDDGGTDRKADLVALME
jgi:hypothetical protein